MRSEKFRKFVSVRMSESLDAQGEFAPFKVEGTSFYSDEFAARGGEHAWFSDMQIQQIRADVNTRRFFERVWVIDQVTAQRVSLRLDAPRLERPEKPLIARETPAPRRGGWLPNRVEIGTAVIRETDLEWGTAKRGSLRGTSLQIHPREGGWDFSGVGGHLAQAGFPQLEVERFKMRYKQPALFVQSAELRDGGSGSIHLNGEVRFNDALDLQATLHGISITPLVAEDWRVRVRGNIGGEVRIKNPLPAQDPPAVSGTLTLEQGLLEALPVLDQIALFTRTQQFRRLVLNKVSADFRQEKGRIEVRNFVGESDGLIRVEGSFTIVESIIDGVFQVGVTPSSLQWLPGSQERVFTQQRGAYVWTAMRLAGPVSKPKEDLSPRLIAAAGGAVIEGVENRVRDTIQTGKDAAKSALDLLMPLLK